MSKALGFTQNPATPVGPLPGDGRWAQPAANRGIHASFLIRCSWTQGGDDTVTAHAVGAKALICAGHKSFSPAVAFVSDQMPIQ